MEAGKLQLGEFQTFSLMQCLSMNAKYRDVRVA